MGSNKHKHDKHRSRKRKHYRSSDSSEKEYEKEKDKDKRKHRKCKEATYKKEKRARTIVDEYISSADSEDEPVNLDDDDDDDDVVIVPDMQLQPPPPPRISNRSGSDRTEKSSSSGNVISWSIEETNKERIKLGLRPLDTPQNATPSADTSRERKETFGGVDMGEFVHKPAVNIRQKSIVEKFKEKMALRKEQRNIEDKILSAGKLASDDDKDEDASAWVLKNRKIVSEKEQAEKRAKELDEMDKVFGIGDLIEEDKRNVKKSAYSAKNLKGLKVEHSMDNFLEGKEVILTLKDNPVLAEGDDTLINVNMLDDERQKKNIDRRRQKPGYNAYEEEDDLAKLEADIDNKILRKYDEELEGEKRDSFMIGSTARAIEEARKESIRNKLQEHALGKKLENLSVNLQLASTYYTEDEIRCKFKKLKKKPKKIRKKPLRADDLLAAATSSSSSSFKDEPREDGRISGGIRSKMNANRNIRIKTDVRDDAAEEDAEFIIETDDLPAPPSIDKRAIKLEFEDEDDYELQMALAQSRKLNQLRSKIKDDNEIMSTGENASEQAAKDAGGSGAIILNSTAEFCRTLGDIPTYGQAGNREEDVQNLLEDFERKVKEVKHNRENVSLDELTNNWNEVEMDSTPVDVVTHEAPILDVEPDISSGVAGALRLAISKGYIQNETEKRPSASRFAHLQAQNYSIEDKAHSLEDDKHARRERYSGPTSDFKEKDGYKPNVKLEYIDDDGRLLSRKEAFRHLSHKFHGKGPGKNKIEKRIKKGEQEALMKQMSSTDTPLGTLTMLQQKQKETHSPYVVLSGRTNVAKLER